MGVVVFLFFFFFVLFFFSDVFLRDWPQRKMRPRQGRVVIRNDMEISLIGLINVMYPCADF